MTLIVVQPVKVIDVRHQEGEHFAIGTYAYTLQTDLNCIPAADVEQVHYYLQVPFLSDQIHELKDNAFFTAFYGSKDSKLNTPPYAYRFFACHYYGVRLLHFGILELKDGTRLKTTELTADIDQNLSCDGIVPEDMLAFQRTYPETR